MTAAQPVTGARRRSATSCGSSTSTRTTPTTSRGWRCSLHDSLVAEGVLSPAPEERDLLWAGAMLHEIGVAMGYDGHPGHSHYLVLNADLAGYGPRETELIGQIVLRHRKGAPAPEALHPATRPGDAELVGPSPDRRRLGVRQRTGGASGTAEPWMPGAARG